MAVASRSELLDDRESQGKLSWELELMAPQPLLRAE